MLLMVVMADLRGALNGGDKKGEDHLGMVMEDRPKGRSLI